MQNFRRSDCAVTTNAPHGSVSAFFVGFDTAFASFDGAVVAAQHQTPYMVIRSDGSTEAFASHADIAVYFQRLLDDYYARGCRSSRHRDLEVATLGTHARHHRRACQASQATTPR